MGKNSSEAIIVESKGFTDKKIKIESLKGTSISVNGDDIASYLDDCFINDISESITQEAKQDIGICRKPRLRYPRYKEENGQGTLLSRSQINEQYVRSIMQNLNKIGAPIQRYILSAMLTGDVFSYKSIAQHIKERSGKIIPTYRINTTFWNIKHHTPIGFLFRKIASKPAQWQIDQRACEIKEEDLYKLSTHKTSGFNIEKACLKYPFLSAILEERTGAEIDLPQQDDQKLTEKDKAEMVEKAPAPMEFEQESNAIAHKSADHPTEALISSILDKGKFDINININFRLLWR